MVYRDKISVNSSKKLKGLKTMLVDEHITDEE